MGLSNIRENNVEDKKHLNSGIRGLRDVERPDRGGIVGVV